MLRVLCCWLFFFFALVLHWFVFTHAHIRSHFTLTLTAFILFFYTTHHPTTLYNPIVTKKKTNNIYMFVFVDCYIYTYIYKEGEKAPVYFFFFFFFRNYPLPFFLCSLCFLFIICRLFINLHVHVLVLIGFRIHTYPYTRCQVREASGCVGYELLSSSSWEPSRFVVVYHFNAGVSRTRPVSKTVTPGKSEGFPHTHKRRGKKKNKKEEKKVEWFSSPFVFCFFFF